MWTNLEKLFRNLWLFCVFFFAECPTESPVKSSPVKQASILRYLSPQKSTAQNEAEQNVVTQSEGLTTSDDVTGEMCTAEAVDVSNSLFPVTAKDKDNAVEADWGTSMEMDWDDGDMDDADLLNQNEAEEEEDEPWLSAKKRKLWRKGISLVK